MDRRRKRARVKKSRKRLTPAAKADLEKAARARVSHEDACPGDMLTDVQVDRAIKGAVESLKEKGIFVAVAGYATYACGAVDQEEHARDFFFFTSGQAGPYQTCQMGFAVTKAIREILADMDKEFSTESARIRGEGGQLPSFIMIQPKGSV